MTSVVLRCIWTVTTGLRLPLNMRMKKSKGWAVWLQTMDIPTGQPPIFRLKSKVCGIVFPAGEVTIVSNAARMELILNK